MFAVVVVVTVAGTGNADPIRLSVPSLGVNYLHRGLEGRVQHEEVVCRLQVCWLDCPLGSE